MSDSRRSRIILRVSRSLHPCLYERLLSANQTSLTRTINELSILADFHIEPRSTVDLPLSVLLSKDQGDNTDRKLRVDLSWQQCFLYDSTRAFFQSLPVDARRQSIMMFLEAAARLVNKRLHQNSRVCVSDCFNHEANGQSGEKPAESIAPHPAKDGAEPHTDWERPVESDIGSEAQNIVDASDVGNHISDEGLDALSKITI